MTGYNDIGLGVNFLAYHLDNHVLFKVVLTDSIASFSEGIWGQHGQVWSPDINQPSLSPM